MFKGPIARATIRTSFVLGLRLIVQAGTLLLVARMLGPAQYGVLAATPKNHEVHRIKWRYSIHLHTPLALHQ